MDGTPLTIWQEGIVQARSGSKTDINRRIAKAARYLAADIPNPSFCELATVANVRFAPPEPDDSTKRASRTAALMSDHHTSTLSIIRPFFEQD
jgi:hypothetical protein